MPIIFMIRHGQALHNVDHTSTTNEKSKLTEKGKNQAKITGQYLSRYNKETKFDLVITSDLIRTIETADIITKELNYKGDILNLKLFNEIGPQNLSPDVLQEANKIISEFREKYKCDPIGYQMNFKDTIKTIDKKFKFKETVEHEHKKILNMIKYLENIKSKKVLLVAHSAIISDIITEVLDLPFYVVPKGYGEKPLGNCGITIFEIKDKNKWKMILPTSTSHLDC